MASRLQLVHTLLQEKRLDGLLVSHQPNITYLTGFPSSDSYLLITSKQGFFITDSRFYQQARISLSGFSIELSGKSVFNTIAKLARSARLKRLGFEARRLDVAQYRQINKLLGPVRFIAAAALIERLRIIKDQGELTKIRNAVHIAAQALRYAGEIIRPGFSELEIAGELERFIRQKGARTTSFETIVAAGRNSAFPHHLTSGKRLKKCDCLFIDMGVDFQGYKSDLTRPFFLGKIPSKISRVYQVVRQAQILAISRIRPGAKIGQIDKYARQYIAKHGYGGFFTHNTGHGLGLEIHEEPYISSHNQATIEPGMVFTVEPAVYLPGEFGIRIEDDIAVNKKGCEVLSDSLDK
jgi:Xaa-Pro aminopeptidase